MQTRTIWDILSQTGIITLISTIVGGLLSIFGGYIANKVHTKNELIEKKKELLETLYVDITKWYNHFFHIYISFTLVLDGISTWNEYLDNINSQNKETNIFSSEITIYLYFPELIDNYKELLKKVQDIYSYIENDIKNSYKINRNILSYKPLLNKKIQEANKLFDNFKQSVIQIATLQGEII